MDYIFMIKSIINLIIGITLATLYLNIPGAISTTYACIKKCVEESFFTDIRNGLLSFILRLIGIMR